MLRPATLKKKLSKPSDPDIVFLGSSLRRSFTSSTLRDMGSCEEEGLFSRSLTVFQNFLGLDSERELLLKATNFDLPDSLSALISNLPEREPGSLSMCVLSLSPNAVLDQADSIPFYRGQFIEVFLLASIYDKSGQVVSLSSHYKHRL